MSFNFKYKSVRLKSGEIIPRPMIPLTLNGKEKIDVIGMLDSGSDMTLIPLELAEILEINYTHENEVFGISGIPVKSKEGKISITFGKGHETYNFEIAVLVPQKENMPMIIGRAGFFNQFKITFFESERKIEFKKVQSSEVKF